MNKMKRLSLHEEIEKEAERIEKEIAEDPNLASIKVSEEMEQELLAKIRAYKREKEKKTSNEEFSEELSPDFIKCTKENEGRYLSKEEKETLELVMKMLKEQELVRENASKEDENKKTVKTVRRRSVSFRRKMVISAAAAMVLVLGVGMTSVGSKSYLKEIVEKITGQNEKATIINVDDMEIQETEDAQEINAYKDIGEQLGIQVVRLQYKPYKMILKKFTIDKEQRRAQLFYQYKDSVLVYSIYVNDEDSSFGQKETDGLVDEFYVENDTNQITVREYQAENRKGHRFVAEFEKYGIQYQMRGTIAKEELKKILENLKFFKKSA